MSCCVILVFNRKSKGIYGACLQKRIEIDTHHTPVEFPGLLDVNPCLLNGMKRTSIEWCQF